jgi:DDE superfamily endonuclease
VIPPKANSAFVAAMEDVLAVYTRPRDPDRPLVCLDETSKQLLAETRVPIAMKPGRPARCDYEYERNGTANLFMMFAPLEGWRRVKVTDRHTAVDYAHVLKDLADVHFANAKTIVWSRTISTSTARRHSTKPFRPPKPGGWSSASNGTTPQSTAVGSIWRSPNSASYRPSASTAGFPIKQPSSRKSPPGSTTAMPTTPRPTGTSQPPTLVSNSNIFTLQSD